METEDPSKGRYRGRHPGRCADEVGVTSYSSQKKWEGQKREMPHGGVATVQTAVAGSVVTTTSKEKWYADGLMKHVVRISVYKNSRIVRKKPKRQGPSKVKVSKIRRSHGAVVQREIQTKEALISCKRSDVALGFITFVKKRGLGESDLKGNSRVKTTMRWGVASG